MMLSYDSRWSRVLNMLRRWWTLLMVVGMMLEREKRTSQQADQKISSDYVELCASSGDSCGCPKRRGKYILVSKTKQQKLNADPSQGFAHACCKTISIQHKQWKVFKMKTNPISMLEASAISVLKVIKVAMGTGPIGLAR
jgi:hypothetical protein